MEDSVDEFHFDDRDQELIEALAGNFCDKESDQCGSDQGGYEDDDRADQDNNSDYHDFNWDVNDDYGVILDNVPVAIPFADENDDATIESIKEEINATKAKLNQLEIKLANAKSSRATEEQDCIGDQIAGESMQKTGKTLLKNNANTTRPGLECFKTATKADTLSKANVITEYNENTVNLIDSKNSQQLSGKIETGHKKEDYNMNRSTDNSSASRKSGNGESLFKKKERLAHKPKLEPRIDRSGIDNVSIEKRKVNIDHKAKQMQLPKEDDRTWRTEAYSGIRIINPCISSTQMDARMADRRFIKLNTIPRYVVNNEISGDWVTMGVIVAKLPPKTSANGKTFSIWRLSDLVLGHENETTSFFLFGNIYKEHWKTSEGTVIALLNSSIMPQRDNDTVGEVAIVIDNPKKLMVMGTSKDFGICKGVTRKGNKCNCVVNKMHGEYCEYHVSREHKKLMAGRMELQSSSTGPDLKKGKRMQAVKKDINSGQVCYAGRTLTWSEKGEKKKKADKKKSMLSTIAGASSNGSSSRTLEGFAEMPKSKPNFDDEVLPEDFKSRLKVPTLGSRNLLKFLKKDEDSENQKQNMVKPALKSAKDLICEQKEENKRSIKPISLNLPVTSTKRRPAHKFDSNFKPTIGINSFDDDFIDFGDSDDIISDALNSKNFNTDTDPQKLIKPLTGRTNDESQAKLKAINLIRSNKIKINKECRVPNSKEKSPRKFEKIKQRVISDISNKDSGEPPNKKHKGILGKIFGEIDLESKEGKKLIAMKSENNHLIQLAEAEQEQAYFNVLEKKEMYEEKMKSVMELKVTAVCCKTCKYMHEFQSTYCKDQGHAIIRVDAVKRFFICKKCQNRTTSLKKFPVQPCRNCGSNNFEKTSMFQEKKGPKIGRETLQVRGEEHAMFLSSLK